MFLRNAGNRLPQLHGITVREDHDRYVSYVVPKRSKRKPKLTHRAGLRLRRALCYDKDDGPHKKDVQTELLNIKMFVNCGAFTAVRVLELCTLY